MDTLSYKTLTPNAQNCPKEWVLIDATDLVLGRLCSEVAKILRGKNKPCYSPFVECGDNVVIINADKVQLTGNKWTDRIYYNFTGYPGGQRELTPEVLMKKSFNKHLKPGMHPPLPPRSQRHASQKPSGPQNHQKHARIQRPRPSFPGQEPPRARSQKVNIANT